MHEKLADGGSLAAKAQIPLYRLPRDVRDKPVSLLSQIPLRRLPRKVGVIEFGLKWMSRVCRGRNGEVSIVEFGLNRSAANVKL